jgi:hypothetical protein
MQQATKLKRNQFKAMVRKDCMQMKVRWCRTLTQFIFSIIIGFAIGSTLKNLITDENPTSQVLGYVLLLLAVPFVYQSSTNYVANEMVRDGETKMKETLKIMGLKPWIYSLSFLVQQGLWLIFPCLALTLCIIVEMSEVIDGSATAPLFFCFWLYSLGMLSLTMVFSNFFSNSKLVNMVLNVIFFVPTGIAMATVISPGTTGISNDWIQYLFWLPNFPWTVIAVDYLKEDHF